jgi:hypothetical protein
MSGRRRLTAVGNRIGVWLYRVSNGRAGGGAHRVSLCSPRIRDSPPR